MKLSRRAIWQRIFRARAEDTLPHIVTHQRVYIVPTRRGLAFLMALLIMLLASVNYSLSLGYALSFLLTGLFAATLLHTYRNVAGLQVMQVSGDTCFTGEALNFQVLLSNARAQPRHGICLRTRTTSNAGARLEAEQDRTLTLSLPAQTRGILRLGRVTLQSDWPLGLWTCWSYLHVPVHGLVFPRPEIDPPPVVCVGDGETGDHAQASHHGDVSGLRDYVPGDTIGSIAWKSVARGHGLQVRTFDAPTAPSQAILSLAQAAGVATLEEQLSRLCAWVLAAERNGIDYTLQLPGETLAAGQGREQRQQALSALALHDPLRQLGNVNRSLGRFRRWVPDLGQTSQASMDGRTLYALAALLLLVQIPHLLHLPAWVSFSGMMLVALRLVLLRHPDHRLLRALCSPVSVTLLAAASTLLIKMDYGYFIGRDPCVAFLFILVAAKFAEVRRPSDGTLLLCLAAFLLLTQYFYSQTILAALVTLPAVVALAHSLAILRDPANPAPAREQWKLITTLLLQGLPLAAVLFLLFPRLPGPLWSLPEDAMASTGLSGSMSPGDIGQLSQSDEVAFRVEFAGRIPEPGERYWRGPVLSEFDGRNWTASTLMLEASPDYQGPEENVVDYIVTLQPHRQRWMFALDAAISLPRADNTDNVSTAESSSGDAQRTASTALAARTPRPLARLMSDGQMIAASPINKVLRYRQSSVLLDAMTSARYPSDNTLFLPGRNTRSIAFAQELRSSANNNLEYAQAVLQHFNQQAFFYTLQPQLLGRRPVDEFLFETRAGFCEHYAAAFVVMMRGAGIPARVVTGYLGGEMNDDYMIVRQSDAHAWAEAYIEGAWRRYDPTGAVAPSRVEQGLAAAIPNESAVPRLARLDAGWLRSTQLRWDALNHHWQRLVIDFDTDSQEKLWDRLGLPRPALWKVTLIVLLLAGSWCAAVLGLPRFNRSRLSSGERLWRRLCRLLSGRNLPRAPDESPAEYLQRAGDFWPAQSERLARLQAQFEQLRFQSLPQSEQAVKQREIRKELWRLEVALFRFR